MRRRLFISVAAAGLVQPAVLRAQGLGAGFPDRPLRLIVAWPVGGSADTIARLFQSRLSEVLRRSIVIENRGGAAGSMGVAEATRAPNDGSAWLFVYDTLATNETAMQLPFRTLEAFVPVCHVASAPLVMVTHPNTPYRSFQDVVDAAKRAPNTINFASSSVGGLPHVATTLLQEQGGFRLVHVPYRGTMPAMQDALSGAVPLFIAAAVALKATGWRPLVPGRTSSASFHKSRTLRLMDRRAEWQVSWGFWDRPVDLPGREKPENRSPEANFLRTS
jgi:tripartite-type tricarboxylate transporter receptor subunit TctC